MIDVVIISDNTHLKNSLRLLLTSIENIHEIESVEQIVKLMEQVKDAVFVLDIEKNNVTELLNQFAHLYKFILYCGSKGLNDIVSYLMFYNVTYFNVYSDPEDILTLITN